MVINLLISKIIITKIWWCKCSICLIQPILTMINYEIEINALGENMHFLISDNLFWSKYLLSIIKAWNPFLTISSVVWSTTNIWFPGMDILVSVIVPVNFVTISEVSLPPSCILRKSVPSSNCSKKTIKCLEIKSDT